MYKTRIKEKYRDHFRSFWKADNPEEEFDVIMSMGNMSLLYCEDNNLLLDIFNNKLVDYKAVDTPPFYVEAKNVEYEDRFDLHGEYRVVGYDSENIPPLLILKSEDGVTKRMLPSRLRVTRIEV